MKQQVILVVLYCFIIILVIGCLLTILVRRRQIAQEEHYKSPQRRPSMFRISFYYPPQFNRPSRFCWSIRFIHMLHPHEFSMEYIHRYYWINYDTCTSLLASKRSTIPFPFSYIEDLHRIWKELPLSFRHRDRKILWYPRDRVEPFSFPVLVKSREMDAPPEGSILFKLNTSRHYRRMVHVYRHRNHEIPFDQKRPTALWRGGPTGYGFGNNIPPRHGSRQTLLEKYAHLLGDENKWVDIGLVLKGSDQRRRYQSYQKYCKDEKSPQDMLSYKYLLSIEGNDVATNLKWIMASQSLTVMPTPKIVSWFREDQLLPYVHYLPIRDDFSDLKDQIAWAEEHPKECREMIRHANQYVEQFMDTSHETELLQNILKKYLTNIKWI